MLTLTTHTLEKLEMLLKTAGYKVRYEKGNFKTGACMLLNSKIIAQAAKVQPLGEPLDWMENIQPKKWRMNGKIVEFDWA